MSKRPGVFGDPNVSRAASLLLALRNCEVRALAGEAANEAVDRATRKFGVDVDELRALWLEKLVAFQQFQRKRLRRSSK